MSAQVEDALARLHQARYAEVKAELERGINLIPFHLREGLIAHCLMGRPCGGFLTAALSNDLLVAVNKMNPGTIEDLRGIMQFLYNYAPPGSWGSPQKVSEWQARNGLMSK